ncbi:MAG: hypothetical protein MUE81_20195 [Thermoflexibacter sp.]|nr:hypothetical protein [Thermoflexibacter sp.]
MKKISILISWLLLVNIKFSIGQIYVNDKDINQEQNLEYIELIVDRRAFNQGQVFAVIDYGQLIRAFTWRQHRIKDDKGVDKLFKSEIDIFNFLYKNGWVHEITYNMESTIYHIFRRKKLINGG